MADNITVRLNSPPAFLEAMITHLTPVGVRDEVVGDLREMYSTPTKFLADFAGAFPYLLFSQVRRNVDVPSFVMQTVLVFCCSWGFLSSLGYTADFSLILLVSLLFVFMSCVMGLYNISSSSSPRAAIIETIVISAIVMLYAYAVAEDLHATGKLVGPQLGWFRWYIVPYTIPVLCGLRAAMVLASEKCKYIASDDASNASIHDLYVKGSARISKRNLRDVGLLLITAVSLLFLSPLGFPGVTLLPSIMGFFFVAVAILVGSKISQKDTSVGDGNDVGLHEKFMEKLKHDNALRRAMSWLWLMPATLLFYKCSLDQPGATHRLHLVYLTAATVVMYFVVSVFNRERAERTRDKLAKLYEMRG